MMPLVADLVSYARPISLPNSPTRTGQAATAGVAESATNGLSRELQKAEQVAKKLGELELRAAKLKAQAAVAGAVAPPVGHRLGRLKPELGPLLAGSRPPPEVAMNASLGPPLQPDQHGALSGQLFVALKFAPDSGEPLARRSVHMEGALHVLLKEARNLAGATGAASGPNSPPSPLCKCYLLDSEGQRVAKQKTAPVKRTSNPHWDQELVFNHLRLVQLAGQGLELLILNRDSILVSAGECLGAIRLCKRTGSDAKDAVHSSRTAAAAATATGGQGEELCSEREAQLWGQMLAKPGIWVYGELPLRQLRPLLPASGQQLVA